MGSKIEAKVAEVIDAYTVVINKGSDNGVAKGQRYLVYRLGKELFDPDTGESLGNLEIICGETTVEHVQSKLAILKTDILDSSFSRPNYITRNPSIRGLSPDYDFRIDETPATICLPTIIRSSLTNVAIGCLVKQIT